MHLLGILFVSIIIAYILTPLCDYLERKMSRAAAISLILLAVGAAIAAFLLLFIPGIIKEAIILVDRFPAIMKFIRKITSNMQNHMETMGIPKSIQDSITAYVDGFQREATETIMGFLERTVSGVTLLPSLFIGLVLGFYFLKDREYFGRVLTNLIPLRSRRKILQAASEMNHILHS